MALPAPKKQLALPPPDPSKQLPSFAAKPKGGQWWTENSPLPVFNPKEALKDEIYMSERFSADPVDRALLDWWDKAVPRYIQNDMATPDDPMRDLAARGVLHTEMTPDEWSKTAGDALAPISLQELMFGEDIYMANLRQKTLETMPWLAKAPATDNVYGVAGPKLGALGFAHVRDELRNALRPDTSGIPMDLALRPESLARMSFPQAAERVGRINQFRVKQMEEQANAALNNPAIQTFKEYPEAGYRWVELRAPDAPEPPADWGWKAREDGMYEAPDGNVFQRDPENPYGFSGEGDYWHLPETAGGTKNPARYNLQEALKFEGDTMGHCVGGYCDDVLSGRSRIFSLRDAKGQPHVTIETAPHRPAPLFTPPEVYERFRAEVLAGMGMPGGPQITADFNRMDSAIDGKIDAWRKEQQATPFPDNIVQIKGKQNRAPVDDYLPYVQDFVKGGTWSNIGDFGNTGLVKLPDGRYITKQQYDEGVTAAFGTGAADLMRDQRLYGPSWLADRWDEVSRNFEGYAVGGRVDASRCFSRNPLSVRAA